MCWIEVPNHVVSEEVRARLESDPTAVVIGEHRGGGARTFLAVAVAFATGAVVGWLWQF